MSLMACTTTISHPGANQPIRPKKECFEMIGTILPYERLGPESLLRATKVLPNAEESLGRGSTPCLDSQPLLFVFLHPSFFSIQNSKSRRVQNFIPRFSSSLFSSLIFFALSRIQAFISFEARFHILHQAFQISQGRVFFVSQTFSTFSLK